MSLQTEDAALRRSLRLIMVAWVFGAFWMYAASGAPLTRYAQLMNMSPFGFGLMAALPFAAALLQLPTSYFIERYGHHKPIFIIAGALHRLVWLAIALIPWVLPNAWWWPALLTLIFVSSIGGHVTNPVWVSWMAALVPVRIRGRFFSRRIQLGQMVGIAVTIAAGVVLDHAAKIGAQVMLKTISAVLAVAAVSGATDFLFFTHVQPPQVHRANPPISLWRMVRQALRDRNFLRFIGASVMLTFATGYVGQFLWLYLFDVVGMTNTKANILLMVIPLAATMLIYPFWGRLVDRLGRKPVMIIASLLIVHGAAAWIFVTRDHWVAGYAAIILATLAWPGVELANFNMLLSLSESPAHRRHGSICVAIYSIAAALAGILSGLFGGAMAEMLSTWQGGHFLGWPVTYHGVLFLISAVFRLLAIFWMVGLADVRQAYSTRAALRYMGSGLYSNLQQAVFIPGRFLLRLGRWTYKLNPGKKA